MPLLMILHLVRLPTWILLVPVSACWRWWVSANAWNSQVEASPSGTQHGYFQVIDKHISTWVPVNALWTPPHTARLAQHLHTTPPSFLTHGTTFPPSHYTYTD